MSLVSSANAAIARRPDFPPIATAPKGHVEIATAADGNAKPETAVTAAMKVVTNYIPTEVLTLYVAVIAVLSPPEAAGAAFSVPPGVFGAFLVGTPVACWMTFAAKIKAAGKGLPARPSQWPVWEMSAATVSFATWAVALPQNPFVGAQWYSPAIAGLCVLVTATMLGLAAPLFQRQLTAS